MAWGQCQKKGQKDEGNIPDNEPLQEIQDKTVYQESGGQIQVITFSICSVFYLNVKLVFSKFKWCINGA